jgi:hypothetical protein
MGIANYISHLRGGYVDDEKEERIEVRVTKEQKRLLQALADLNSLSVSSLLRMVIVGLITRPKRWGLLAPPKEGKKK